MPTALRWHVNAPRDNELHLDRLRSITNAVEFVFFLSLISKISISIDDSEVCDTCLRLQTGVTRRSVNFLELHLKHKPETDWRPSWSNDDGALHIANTYMHVTYP